MLRNLAPIRNPYHPDIPIFLVMIPLVSAFNYYLTYTNPQLNWFMVLTFTLDTFQGYCAIWGVRSIILYLDRVLPYDGQELKRILVQLACTTFIGLFIISVLTELTSLIARGEFVNRSFYTHALFIISIWFFVVNGIYVMLHFYHRWRQSETTQQTQERLVKQGFLVKSGNKDIRLTFEEIAGFSVEGDLAVAHEMTGKKYFLDQSLNDIEGNVPPTHFFRLNRQYILHRDMLAGFNRAENGKLQALLKPHPAFPSEITISRLKAADFKKWFRPE